MDSSTPFALYSSAAANMLTDMVFPNLSNTKKNVRQPAWSHIGLPENSQAGGACVHV
jgi:hypothetical protein